MRDWPGSVDSTSRVDYPGRVMLRRTLALASLVVFGMVTGFCAFEGLASLVLFVGKIVTFRVPTFNERLYTRYDPQLGWASRPGVFLENLYGPGISLRTNAQGFRADHDVAREAPSGRARVICSGDSFTLGYGVADDRTWCARLAAAEPRLETVNLGQGGYGIDQAYLWYLRDGAPLEHTAHVFAVITSDFARMRQREFAGHGKPVLAIEDGKLVTRNVPVPERPSRFPFLGRRLAGAVADLRMAQLVARVRGGGHGGPATDADDAFDAATWEVAAKVFETLAALHRDKQRTFLVVYLPTRADYDADPSAAWRGHLGALAPERGFTFVDLVPSLQALPIAAVRTFFIPPGSPGAGHYTNEGNQWVADRLRSWLAAMPALRELAAPPRAGAAAGHGPRQ